MGVKIGTIFKLPAECILAFSGGVDSSVLLDILIRRRVKVTLLTIDHLTKFSKDGVDFCKYKSAKYNLPFIIRQVRDKDLMDPNGKTSKEAHWFQERSLIFNEMELPVLTAHNLSDVVESYIMTTFHGKSKIILPRNGNVYRPLLGTTKEDINKYASERNVEFISDPSNDDPNFCLRNKVRHSLVGEIKECFPGLNKVVKKIVLRKLSESPVLFN